MQLPSRFQIGDTVTVKRESGKVSMPKATIQGVQFTEGKVHYLVAEEPTHPYSLVDSAYVHEEGATQELRDEA